MVLNSGIFFSASETVAMHFYRLRGVHPDQDLHLHDRRISSVEETRFLGLKFDSRLTWVNILYNLRYIYTLRHTLSPSLSTQMVQSDEGVRYNVIFPSFCGGGSLPRVASVFTTELSAIIPALKIIFTFPVSSFTILSDSRSASSVLEHFTSSLYP